MTNFAWPDLGPRARPEAERDPVVPGAGRGLTAPAEVGTARGDAGFVAAFADEVDQGWPSDKAWTRR